MYKKSKIENKTKNRKAIQVRSFKNIEKDKKKTGKNIKNGRKICKYIKKLFDKKEKTNKKK